VADADKVIPKGFSDPS